ncbi:hypothetical protein A3Q56_02873, partial [Intoshia linei]
MTIEKKCQNVSVDHHSIYKGTSISQIYTNPCTNDMDNVYLSVFENNFDKFIKLLSRFQNFNFIFGSSNSGFTLYEDVHSFMSPISLCSYLGLNHFVEYLLRSGVQIDSTIGDDLITPLMLATYSGQTETVQLLLRFGANVKYTDVNQNSPLIYAIRGTSKTEEKQKIVEMLIKAGSDVNYTNKFGNGALHEAVLVNEDKLVNDLIVKYNANLTHLNRNGKTALHLAIITRSFNNCINWKGLIYSTYYKIELQLLKKCRYNIQKHGDILTLFLNIYKNENSKASFNSFFSLFPNIVKPFHKVPDAACRLNALYQLYVDDYNFSLKNNKKHIISNQARYKNETLQHVLTTDQSNLIPKNIYQYNMRMNRIVQLLLRYSNSKWTSDYVKFKRSVSSKVQNTHLDNFVDDNGFSAFDYALIYNDLQSAFILSHFAVDKFHFFKIIALGAIYEAIINDNHKKSYNLIKMDPHLNVNGKFSPAVVRRFCSLDIDVKSKTGTTPLILAVKYNNVPARKLNIETQKTELLITEFNCPKVEFIKALNDFKLVVQAFFGIVLAI